MGNMIFLAAIRTRVLAASYSPTLVFQGIGPFHGYICIIDHDIIELIVHAFTSDITFTRTYIGRKYGEGCLPHGEKYGPVWKQGDTVGCGWHQVHACVNMLYACVSTCNNCYTMCIRY